MFMLSCVHDPKPSRDMLVVEGWIEDNDYPMVFVTSSITSTFREQGLTDIMDHLALDAEVKITYAGKSYQLFPKLDPNYLMTIYYTTKNLKGKVGGTYRLDVNWRGLHASGTTTIPEHGSIDSIAVERNKSIDTLYVVKAHIVPTPSEHRYYRFFTQVIGQDKAYTASVNGLYDSELVREEDMIFANRGYSNPLDSVQAYYQLGDSVHVKLASMDSDSYRFWSKYNENIVFGSLAVMPYSTNLEGNLDGALGYFAGYATDVYKIRVRE